MRILVVSDIHANRAALEAVRESFDACLCLGDIVEYGPDPEYCIDWVRGNHDHGCVQNVEVPGLGGFRYLTKVTRQITMPRLGVEDRRFLATLPTTSSFKLDGLRFLLVHASPRDPLEEYVPLDPKLWEARIKDLKVDFVCVGHTHQQFVLPIGNVRVLNPGSVGLPRDGDPRARYAIIENGKVELKQVEYDIESTVSAVMASALDDEAKTQLAEVYRLGKYQYVPSNGNGIVHKPEPC
jgi:putative phosphoesterase